MKKYFSLLSLTILVFIFSSCLKRHKDSGCKSTAVRFVKTVDLIDYNSASVYYNQTVAIVTFIDSTIDVGPVDEYSICRSQDECKIYVTIQNKTTKQLTMTYRLKTASFAGNLDYQNNITIPAAQTADLGKVTNDCLYIGQSSVAAESNNITYF